MPARAMTRRKAPGSTDPVSVRFPPKLRRRAERFASRRHLALASAVRTIVGEYLDDLDTRESLTRAEQWQRLQAWEAAQSLLGRNVPEAAWDDLRNDHATVLRGLSRKRARRS